MHGKRLVDPGEFRYRPALHQLCAVVVSLMAAAPVSAVGYQVLDLFSASLPASANSIFTNRTNGSTLVGYGYVDLNNSHALLWTGQGSPLDLNPTNFAVTSSIATASWDNTEVGSGAVVSAGGLTHALLWNGTSSAAIDLHLLLPANFQKSWATSIDATGNVFGFAFDPASGTHAIEWVSTSTPEPACLSLLGLGAAALLARRRNQHRTV